MSALPTGSQERKAIPLARGCIDYFPAALAAVAELSRAGNDKHNPGEEMYHARGKSMDHADCIARHLVDRGTVDPEDGIPHSTKVAWRALALLQEELEAGGAPLARGARLPDTEIEKQEFWTVGSVHPICGYDGDTAAGVYRIVDFRLPKHLDQYIYLDPSSESGRPSVQTAVSDHPIGSETRCIVERV